MLHNAIEAIKQDMYTVIDCLEADKIEEAKNSINNLFDVYDYLSTVSEMSNKGISVKDAPSEEPKTLPTKQEEETQTIEVKETNDAIDKLAEPFEPKAKGHPFVRKLKTGWVKRGSKMDDIFVPMTIIRALDLHNGDIVQFNGSAGQSRLYPEDFTVVDTSRRTPVEDMEEFQYGKIQYDKTMNQYYVDKDIYGNSLYVDGHLYRYHLSESEEKDLGIQTGDIVDVVWYKNNPNTMQVVWRYTTDEEVEKTVAQRVKEHRQSQPKDKEDDIPKELFPSSLKNKRIVLVGLEPKWGELKEAIARYGGTLDCVEPGKNKISKSASYRKADVIMFSISHSSHGAYDHAKMKAKEYKKPFVEYVGYGTTGFVNDVHDALGLELPKIQIANILQENNA